MKEPKFKVGEVVKHWSGDIGKVDRIGENIIYVTYADGSRSECRLNGMAIRGSTRVIYKLTKLEIALQ
jgi:hypothetical protein